MINEHPVGFVAVRPADVQWVLNPEVPGIEAAVILGNPEEPGPLIVRVRLPPNIRIEAHTHPDARTYTILSGEWKLGFGERFDAQRLQGYPQGSLYRLPAKVPHFQATGPDGAVIQIESIGPTSIEFFDPQNKWSLPDNK